MHDTGNASTAERLLDCAQILIQRHGVNGFSYRDLEAALHIRTASIHYHFRRKDDLIGALLSRCQQRYGAAYRRIVGEDAAALDKLREIAKLFAANLDQDFVCVVGMLSAERSALSASNQTQLAQAILDTATTFATIFIQGAQDQTLRAADDPQVAGHAFFSALIGMQLLARAGGGRASFDAQSAVLISSYQV